MKCFLLLKQALLTGRYRAKLFSDYGWNKHQAFEDRAAVQFDNDGCSSFDQREDLKRLEAPVL